MKTKGAQGLFEVIDSFAIRNRNQFYFIGRIKEGEIKKNWFVNIQFNSTISMSVKINDIEQIEMTSEDEAYTLLIADCDDEVIDLYLGLNIGLEYISITIEGEE